MLIESPSPPPTNNQSLSASSHFKGIHDKQQSTKQTSSSSIVQSFEKIISNNSKLVDQQDRPCTRSSSAITAVTFEQSEKNTIAQRVKKSRIHKRKKLRRAQVIEITKCPLNMNHIFHISADIFISSDLEIRLGGVLQWGIIGTSLMTGAKLTKNEIGIEINEMVYKNRLQKLSMKSALSQISSINTLMYQQFTQAFSRFDFCQNYMIQQAKVAPMSKEKQAAQYEEFCEKSWKQIQSISESESLIGYVTGRSDAITDEVHIESIGYSNGLMNVLCLNSEVLNSMFLRNKQINVFVDQAQIQELSLLYLMDRVGMQNNDLKSNRKLWTYRMQLTTIDGYKLWVNQTFQRCMDVEAKGRTCNFFNLIVTFDIETRDLEGLIEYRSSLAQRKGISFDRLVQIELSQLLEDVEYSVQSQLFMEKYYSDSVEELKAAVVRQNKRQQRLLYS